MIIQKVSFVSSSRMAKRDLRTYAWRRRTDASLLLLIRNLMCGLM